MTHIYWRLHVPTGRKQEIESDHMTRADLFALLNRFNTQQPGVWVYWQDAAQRNGT